ncbi:MAG TPA: phosphoribosyltransferase family protein [Streptosporangiaceae bacterium]|nr:phosphoribosyltransferase family protein [Streptosporangiaceae bacterium]
MFVDRRDAGRRLADRLRHLRGTDVVVVGLPRGGVLVAAQVAGALDAALDVIMVRKLGVPSQPELAMGAIGEDGIRVSNPLVMHSAGVTAAAIAAAESRERDEIKQRLTTIRDIRPAVPLRGRTVVIIDDGVATGATAAAACRVARGRGAARVILAIPVIAADAARALQYEADEVIALVTPERLSAVGQWYHDFSDTSHREVCECLRAARRAGENDPRDDLDQEVEIDADGVHVPGHLTVPVKPVGIVIFAHGSGSSHRSPRNRYVAEVLHEAGLGTLLFDLLTPREAEHRAAVFDVALLGARLFAATSWARSQAWGKTRSVGWFGASTGAAAALWAAAKPDAAVSAIVSRGGRPDLAGSRLSRVHAPTLLIVGGLDTEVLHLNQSAAARLMCPNRLIVVPGATHLFEEPGTLTAAAGHARDWFTAHLKSGVDAAA